MSFILDALRRAESERRQGRLPDLQSVPGSPSAEGARSDAQSLQRRLGLGALAVAGGAALAWWLWPAQAPQAPAVAAAADAPARGPATGSPPPTRSVPEPMPILPAPMPVPPAAPPQAAVPAGEAATARAPVGGAAQPTALPAPTPAAPNAAVAASAALPVPAASAAPSPPAARVVALADLPDDLRRALPPLNVSGASYSETAANRLLFLNGQLLREGDAVTPELTLEAIQLRGAVLVFRGQRFRIAF